MSSPYETGHVNNMANFEELITFCISLGDRYNPSNKAITTPAMQSLLTRVKDKTGQHRMEKTASTNATDIKKDYMKLIRTYARQIVNALEIHGASAAKIENARDLIDKLDGKRLTPLPDPEPAAQPAIAANNPGEDAAGIIPSPGLKKRRTRSSSQTGVDNSIEHFAKIVEIIKSEPGYQPNEEVLTLPYINTKLLEFQAINKSAVDTGIAETNTLAERLSLMYEDVTGMVDIGNMSKLYIKTVFGPNSDEYRKVRKLTFRKPRKRR